MDNHFQSPKTEEVCLTSMCSCAGCAAKIRASDLEKVLRNLPLPADSRVLAGHQSADDAVVVRVSDKIALVQTVDFFTPVVDDPYRFGRVAAANALSDVYAMGGTPFTAMNIACFPTKKLGVEILGQILKGGLEKVLEAGAVLAGGHTIEDDEPKFGLAVTGIIDPECIVSKAGCQPGDVLVLTKPLGTGVLNTAQKRRVLDKEHLENVLCSMELLNRQASQAMLAAAAHGATDVTGYSLLGHTLEMCRASQVCAEIFTSAVPLLPGAVKAYEQGCIPGGSKANLQYVSEFLAVNEGVSATTVGLLADAQTSGGLLIALPEERVEQLLKDIPEFFQAPAVVGRVVTQENPGQVKISLIK